MQWGFMVIRVCKEQSGEKTCWSLMLKYLLLGLALQEIWAISLIAVSHLVDQMEGTNDFSGIQKAKT